MWCSLQIKANQKCIARTASVHPSWFGCVVNGTLSLIVAGVVYAVVITQDLDPLMVSVYQVQEAEVMQRHSQLALS